MNYLTLIIGLVALIFGIATLIIRIKNPAKFKKLTVMKEKFGEKPGVAIHTIFYTVLPVVVGIILITAVLVPFMRLGGLHRFGSPVNNLEEKMVAFLDGKLESAKFIKIFLKSEVYVLTPQDQLNPRSGRLVKNPSLFTITSPEYTLFCVYTSQKRIDPTVDKYPELKYAARVFVKDLLSSVRRKWGLIINPYWDVNLTWEPKTVAKIKNILRKQR
ncbi:MAG: SseB family protein [Candidatus Omnitrophota bacterium]|nr:MAG: SseB family protein [Candidatus Omnitrophota bacterium]